MYWLDSQYLSFNLILIKSDNNNRQQTDNIEAVWLCAIYLINISHVTISVFVSHSNEFVMSEFESFPALHWFLN